MAVFILFPYSSPFMGITDKGAAVQQPVPEQTAAEAAKTAPATQGIPPSADTSADQPQHDWKKRYDDSKQEASKMLAVQVDMVLENPVYLESLASKDRGLAEQVSKKLTVDGAPATSLEQVLAAIRGVDPEPAHKAKPIGKDDEEEVFTKFEARQAKKAAESEVLKSFESLPAEARKLALEKWEARKTGSWDADRIREEAEIVTAWAKTKVEAPAKRDLTLAQLAGGVSVASKSSSPSDPDRKARADALYNAMKQGGLR